LACPSNVKKGFIATGVLDEKSEVWPNLYAMVNTCKKRNLDKNLYMEEFEELLLYARKGVTINCSFLNYKLQKLISKH
jgi:hypothetical protein